MTYQSGLFFHYKTTDAPARQTISTAYTELTGSRAQVQMRSQSNILRYEYSCELSTIYDFTTGASGAYDKLFLHGKLQKSNDNFVSNIVDIDYTKHNVSGDTDENRDYYYITHSPFFIINDFGNYTHIRFVARSYNTNRRVDVHRARQFDGVDTDETYYNVSLKVFEVQI